MITSKLTENNFFLNVTEIHSFNEVQETATNNEGVQNDIDVLHQDGEYSFIVEDKDEDFPISSHLLL